MLQFILKDLPTVNHYWHHVNNKKILSAKARLFRAQVTTIVSELNSDQLPLSGSINIAIVWRVPDNRKRDIDNIVKPILDSLVVAGLLKDDSYVILLVVKKCKEHPSLGKGECRVSVWEEAKHEAT